MTLSLTLILILISVAASFYAWNNPAIMSKWIMNPYSVNRRKEYYRFITSGLIHADYMHLLFNMIALYSFGNAMEYIFGYYFGGYGLLLYLLLYVLGIIVSDIPTYLKHKDNSYYNSLGASGGVSAIVFASIMFNPLAKMGLIFLPIFIPGFIFGTIYLIYSHYQAQRGGDYINHDAHIFGAIFGIVFSIVVMPSVLLSFAEQISGWIRSFF
jgi:membrane associated rhomboid family serine protease